MATETLMTPPAKPSNGLGADLEMPVEMLDGPESVDDLDEFAMMQKWAQERKISDMMERQISSAPHRQELQMMLHWAEEKKRKIMSTRSNQALRRERSLQRRLDLSIEDLKDVGCMLSTRSVDDFLSDAQEREAISRHIRTPSEPTFQDTSMLDDDDPDARAPIERARTGSPVRKQSKPKLPTKLQTRMSIAKLRAEAVLGGNLHPASALEELSDDEDRVIDAIPSGSDGVEHIAQEMDVDEVDTEMVDAPVEAAVADANVEADADAELDSDELDADDLDEEEDQDTPVMEDTQPSAPKPTTAKTAANDNVSERRKSKPAAGKPIATKAIKKRASVAKTDAAAVSPSTSSEHDENKQGDTNTVSSARNSTRRKMSLPAAPGPASDRPSKSAHKPLAARAKAPKPAASRHSVAARPTAPVATTPTSAARKRAQSVGTGLTRSAAAVPTATTASTTTTASTKSVKTTKPAENRRQSAPADRKRSQRTETSGRQPKRAAKPAKNEWQFDDEEAKQIVVEVYDQVLEDTGMDTFNVSNWLNKLSADVVRRLEDLHKPFKYIVHGFALPKTDAGLNMKVGCIWENDLDGTCSVKFSTSQSQVVVTVFGIAL